MKIAILRLDYNQINKDPIEMTVSESDYPISPLISIESCKKTKNNKVRMIVYIPSKVKEPPRLKIGEDKNGTIVRIINGKKVLARSFTAHYTCKTKNIPTFYNAWSIFVEYNLNGIKPVPYAVGHLKNDDPKTSRGTVTTVQDPVG